MTEIAYKQLMRLSTKPITNLFKRWYLKVQVRAHDRHIEFLEKSIRNDQKALRIITTERIRVAARLRGL
jgi:hypothetical protein